MARFIYHTRHNPCPICESTSGKCRSTGDLVLCMDGTGGMIGDPPGYWYVRDTQDGMWGIYAPEDGRQRSWEWDRKREEREREQKQRERTHEGGLTLTDRDHEFRALLTQLELASDHRDNLRARGLSDEAIAAGMFRTVEPGQAIEVNPKLPGARRGRFRFSDRGILCPAFDRRGRIVGAQVRLDNGKGGRYRWLKGDRSSHLQNGELPLAVARPEGEPKGLAIVEGILKPYVAAQRHGFIVIGAAGGNCLGSPEQLAATLETSQTLGTTIYFPVDAGARSNPHVYRRDGETIRQLERWGYRVLVGDWGQWEDKAAGDFDEIDPDTAIAWRPAGDYLPEPGAASDLRELSEKLKTRRPKAKGFAPQAPKPASSPLRYSEKVPPSPRVYEPAERLATWEEGGPFVLDASETGSGKSHSAGAVAGKVIYLTADPRNVTVPTLQDWDVLEGRHNGLEQDDTGRWRRTEGSGERERGPNCARTGVIGALRAKGVQQADHADLICKSCPYLGSCHAGTTFGYLGDRTRALAQDKFIAHPAALPAPSQFDYSNYILVWDEAEPLVKSKREITAGLGDLQATITALALKAPEVMVALQPFLGALKDLLTGDSPHYGFSHHDLLERLPSLPEGLDTEVVRGAIAPDLEAALNPYHDGIDLRDIAALRHDGDASVRRLAQGLLKSLRDSDLTEQVNATVLNQWLPELLAVLAGQGGHLQLRDHRLTITRSDPHLATIAQAAKQNIFLDATGDREEFAALLGVEPEAIAYVAAATGEPAQVRVVQVTGLGKLGVQRREGLQNRVKAVRAELQRRHPDLVTIDLKRYAEPGDLIWMSTSRGANDAAQASAIALIGTPIRNLHALAADFAITYGYVPHRDDPAFGAYVERAIAIELQQGLGRLRANRRPGEALTVYLLTDYPLPFPVTEQISAGEISPEARSKLEQTQAAIAAAIQWLTAQGKDITQAAVARVSKYSRQYVSRLWTWVQQTLLEPLVTKGAPPPDPSPPPDPPDPPDPAAAEIAASAIDLLELVTEQLTPEEFTEEVLELFLSYLTEPCYWQAFWEQLPDHLWEAVLTPLLALPGLFDQQNPTFDQQRPPPTG